MSKTITLTNIEKNFVLTILESEIFEIKSIAFINKERKDSFSKTKIEKLESIIEKLKA